MRATMAVLVALFSGGVAGCGSGGQGYGVGADASAGAAPDLLGTHCMNRGKCPPEHPPREHDFCSEIANCGACGAACSGDHLATVECSNGVCTGICAPGYADCNGTKQSDGCETVGMCPPPSDGGADAGLHD